MSGTELLEVADSLADIHHRFNDTHSDTIQTISKIATEIAKSWSGSNLGYQAFVYYTGLKPRPPNAQFSSEWGIREHWPIEATTGDWREFSSDDVTAEIFRRANEPNLDAIRIDSSTVSARVSSSKAELLSNLDIALGNNPNKFLEDLQSKAVACTIADRHFFERTMRPARQVISRDSLAVTQGFKTAPHQTVLADMLALSQPSERARELSEIARQAGSHLRRIEQQTKRSSLMGTNVFVGHGRAPAWRILKDFVKDRLRLSFDEFNRVPVAGMTNVARLSEMLDSAAIAFIVLTAEDELADGKQQARMNVIHEVGLFQGRLGFNRAIVVLEQGCEEFSNIQGLGQIRFPKDNIAAAFEEIRLVLEREGIIGN